MLSPSLRGPPVQGDPALGALRARTQLWFQQTQVGRLRAEGELPPWFHGFISRREAEQLLQDEPLGCFLVRFSESTVGFVLPFSPAPGAGIAAGTLSWPRIRMGST
uniref:SH2 domain-containing protein n=1 Tax=Strigops habroptila TaxID=2489341 RepID=A0A672UX52_STRHB